MAEYCIFQKDFDSYLYIQREDNWIHNFNKQKILEFAAQIPKKLCKFFSDEEKIDHGYLNCLQKVNHKKDLQLYVLKNDYLNLTIFLKIFNKENIDKLLPESGLKITKYFFEYINSSNIESFLVHSVETGNYYIVNRIIDEGYNFEEDEKYIFLNKAFIRKNYNIAELLLTKLRYSQDEIEDSVLDAKLEAVKFLLKKGYKITRQINLADACFCVNYELVQLLIDNGCRNFINTNAVLLSVSNIKILELLIQNGADITGKEYLMFKNSCIEGYIEIVKYLFNESFNLPECFTLACKYENLGIVKFLVKNGVDVNCDNNRGFIIACCKNIEIVKYLVKNGVNIQAQNNLGLVQAFDRSKKEIFLFLIENGANINSLGDYMPKLKKLLKKPNSLELILRKMKQYFSLPLSESSSESESESSS